MRIHTAPLLLTASLFVAIGCSSEETEAPAMLDPGSSSGNGNASSDGGGGTQSDAGSSSTPDATPEADAATKPVVLGTVTENGNCTKPSVLSNAKCFTVTVSGCPGVPALDADLLVADPLAGPAKGTIIFGSGSGGGSFYEDVGDGAGAAGPMLERLHTKGYRIVERAWAGPPQTGQWFEGSAGPAANSCRYATLATYIKTKFHKNEGKFCGTGNSGGSVELATSLTRQGRGDIFDYALLTSGPAARFQDHCETTSSPTWKAECDALTAGKAWECNARGELGGKPMCAFDPGIKELVDSAYRPTSPCSEGGAANAQKLADGSPLGPGAQTVFRNTRIELLEALNDCRNGVVPAGLAFAKAVTSQGAPPKVTFLSGVGHSMHANVEGAAAIEAAMEASCK